MRKRHLGFISVAQLLALQRRTGRGRPRQTLGHQGSRDAPVFRMIEAVKLQGVKRGDWVLLQRKVQTRYGIASSEFYKILARWRYWQRTWIEPMELVHRELSPAERAKWQHRPFAEVVRLARRRARRKE